MSAELERVLEVLDVGLQKSGETGFSTDFTDWCARCQLEDPLPDADLCAGCRAFLLGDTDDDPAAEYSPSPRSAHPSIPGARALRSMGFTSAEFDRAMRRASETFAGTGEDIERFRERAFPASSREDGPALRPRHATTRVRISIDHRQLQRALRAAVDERSFTGERIRAALRAAIRISPERSGRLR